MTALIVRLLTGNQYGLAILGVAWLASVIAAAGAGKRWRDGR